jgi:hypothetical protein
MALRYMDARLVCLDHGRLTREKLNCVRNLLKRPANLDGLQFYCTEMASSGCGSRLSPADWALAVRARTARRPRSEARSCWVGRPVRHQGREGSMADSEFEEALTSTNEVELTITGRVSARESSRPVWFVRKGETLYLLPVTGSESQWYRNVVRTPRMRLTAGGAEHSADATPITDLGEVGHVVDDFRAKYGAANVAQYRPWSCA